MSATSHGPAVRPFTFGFSDAELEDLRTRVLATRWPDKETVPDQSQGTQLATVRELARYWASEYDWRRAEAALKGLPHFVTEIDGLDIHFLHVRSVHDDALPLVVTHGWPGSIVEQLKIIAPLTDPTAHGGSAADAFHVVVPSLPGYGFSGKPATTGWTPERIARAWAELMDRLGYTKYGAQGGDWGAIVTDFMGVRAPRGLVGIHTNMPGAVPPAVHEAIATGSPLPSGMPLSDEEKAACGQLDFVYRHDAYARMMASRPQSLTALADSPVGLAAFLLDHDAASLELISRAFAGHAEGLTRDDVLDNVTLFWLTNTALSAARLYAENKDPFFVVRGVSVPAAVSVFPDELYQAPRSWAEQAYPNLVHYRRLGKGGHFAAWEQPDLLVREIRAGFRSLR
ncbi:epoxide hydrolase family protein [Streptomyces minutiscleroticus]|uniref:Hydrolase n=1 Tax=Streptomyces minutiscleroticus TaxID=68238 RepID=A0A918U2V9_9ACTN|nr:epoxide hydrolase family protein [Streptomyces minutiscleroticus]GGX84442.1 hydrolase [Streptomyces minutiscleroticus]